MMPPIPIVLPTFVVYETWAITADERTCKECLSMLGQVWREGEGPQPPLHPGCRCRRVFHHIEWIAKPPIWT
jgi:hypothetical protein